MSLSSNDLEASIESTDNTAKCRICWRTCYVTELLSPCVCSGSQKYVHFECLSRWIQERESDNKDICDICQHQYQNITLRQKEKNFIQWLTEEEDVIGAIFLSLIIIAFFVYILNMGCIQFVISVGKVHNVIRYIQLALIVFLGLIFVIGVIAALFLCRQQYKEWQTSHYTTIVERFVDSRRSTISSLSCNDNLSSESSSISNERETEDKELLSSNPKTTVNQSYGSLC